MSTNRKGIIAVFIFLTFFSLFNQISLGINAQDKSESLDEIRENLLEIRLALQKGDIIEALQHLNNAEEYLLLLETNTSSVID